MLIQKQFMKIQKHFMKIQTTFLDYSIQQRQIIKLKECPAYGKPTVGKQPDIELEECPAYCVVKKKDV